MIMDIQSTIDSVTEGVNQILSDSLFTRYGLLGLFANGILAPILPIPPELTRFALVLSGESKALVVLVLSAAWILGGILWYYVSFTGNRVILKRLRGDSQQNKSLKKGHRLLDRYGWVIILVSPWIPILGDIIVIIAGVKRYSPKKYIISMSIGKIIRAVAIVFFTSWMTNYYFV